jgi:hypothetical protein
MRAHQLAVLSALFGLIVAVQDASAAGRTRWVHERGSFENTTGDEWVEVIVLDGRAVEFRFREVARNGDYIEVHDASRDCYVRLYDDAVYVKNIKDGFREFRRFYSGRWRD